MSISSILQRCWLLIVVALALTACGGGGSSGTPIVGGGNSGGSAAVANLQIKFSPTSVDNTGTQNVTATVTALDANGQGVQGVPLTLKVDKNATYAFTTSTGNVTGTDGTVTADVTIGNDYSARTITVTATDGTLTKTGTFDVTASSQRASDLIVTATPSTLLNSVANTATVTVTAVDANRNALAGIPVTLTVDNGATIAPSGTVTATGGKLTGVVSMGSDVSNRVITVTATSGTVQRTVAITVQGAKLVASGLVSTLPSGQAGNSVVYQLVDNAGASMGRNSITVAMQSAAGTSSVSGQTDADGRFSYAFAAPSTPGTLTLTATAAGVTRVDSIDVTSTSDPAPVTANVRSATISASPSVVLVNASGSTANKTELRALFLGDNNQPVQNVRVWFDLPDALNVGGTIASQTADKRLLYSDASGVARTTYAPGSRSSPKDGVTVRVCWDKVRFDPATQCPNAATNTLTITEDSVSVSIGTNGTLGTGASGGTYTKQFVVQVVDGAGRAKAGVQISPSIDLLSYFKGEWKVISGAVAWAIGGLGNSYPTTYPPVPPAVVGATVPAEALASKAQLVDTSLSSWAPYDVVAKKGGVTICDNEDLNRNGVSETFLDAYEGVVISEDQNSSLNLTAGRPALDPRKADVTVSVVGSDTTDSSGIVVLKIEYPQNVAGWLKYNLVVSASGVAGTEGRANFQGVLPVLASAVNDVKTDPPFRVSPYGTEGSPTYLRKNALGQSGWLCTDPN